MLGTELCLLFQTPGDTLLIAVCCSLVLKHVNPEGMNRNLISKSSVVQQVKGLVFSLQQLGSLLQLGFNPWSWNFHAMDATKKRKEKERNLISQFFGLLLGHSFTHPLSLYFMQHPVIGANDTVLTYLPVGKACNQFCHYSYGKCYEWRSRGSVRMTNRDYPGCHQRLSNLSVCLLKQY